MGQGVTMALIIEDGTGVTNSNTYVTDVEYTDYATSRGLTVGLDATAREQELIMANDFLESFRADYQGVKTSGANSLQFPRNGVYIDGVLNASTNIPIELKRAQMEAAAFESSSQLTTNTPDQNVQSETVDVISISYYNGGKAISGKYERVNNWLEPLLKNKGAVSLVRI